ncbi:MAG: hypothetical protein AAF078_12505 [Planctomycetota bacterium]
MSHRLAPLFALALCVAALGVGCKQLPHDTALIDAQETLAADAQAMAETFKDRDPTIRPFFDTAHAYIVFPEVAIGPAGSGLAAADGVVFKHGRQTGYAALTEGKPSGKPQGQSFAQVVFFETEEALADFTGGHLHFEDGAEAVAAVSGAAAQVSYTDGLAVFTTAERQRRFNAALANQKIRPVATESEREL